MRALLVVLALTRVAAADDTCESRAYCFDLAVHVADEVVTPDWLAAQVTTANRHFAPVDVGFRIARTDARSVAHVATREDRTKLGAHVSRGVIDVFVTGRLDDVDAKDAQIRGVAWKVGGKKIVILSAIAAEVVLAHELGHVFGLPHSTYAVSIMNKTPRTEPPWEQRTFAPEELAALPATVKRLVRSRVLVNRASARR